MVTYKRIKTAHKYRYTKLNEKGQSSFVSAERVPQEILDKFDLDEAITQLQFDDKPERPRCLFCEAPATKQRMVNLVMVDICDYHYLNKTVGKIAEQLRINKEKATWQAEAAAKPSQAQRATVQLQKQ